jgi:serine/threonine-protein kinase
MPITAAAGLLEALREHRVLDADRLEKVERATQGRTVDVRTLAKELVKRGYLTTFQVNRLLQGRGAELVLEDYLLLDQLGEGGMGQVFKARHQRLNRVVALKVIRPECLASPELVERFRREVQAVASLSHPNIVAAQDARQVGRTLLLVTEYVEGTDLQRLVEKSGRPLPVGQACDYVRQAALGLQQATANRLIHRDIKPSNLQVTTDRRVVKILDMGLARLQAEAPGEAAGLTKAHTVMGTPDYIAPEQIVNPRAVDCRADIYSLGCTFYFLLTGRPPFGSVERWEEKLVCHQKVEPQPIEQVRPDVPPQVGAILRRMMAKQPGDRYAAPAAVADDLAPYCQTPGPVPAAPGSLVSQPAEGTERGWTLPTDSVATPAPGSPATPTGPWGGPTVLVNTPQPASSPPGQQPTGPAGQPVPRALASNSGLSWPRASSSACCPCWWSCSGRGGKPAPPRMGLTPPPPPALPNRTPRLRSRNT